MSFIRYNEKAISLGPAGPGPQFRLGMAKLETGEMIIVNKNVFFDDGRPMKNRLVKYTGVSVSVQGGVNIRILHLKCVSLVNHNGGLGNRSTDTETQV